MRDLLRLFTPPEWNVWSLVQKAVYWAVFLGAMLALKALLFAIADPVFHQWR